MSQIYICARAHKYMNIDFIGATIYTSLINIYNFYKNEEYPREYAIKSNIMKVMIKKKIDIRLLMIPFDLPVFSEKSSKPFLYIYPF